jgi:hypothetical protein
MRKGSIFRVARVTEHHLTAASTIVANVDGTYNLTNAIDAGQTTMYDYLTPICTGGAIVGGTVK